MTTWDEAKRGGNIAKHGLDLALADGFDFDRAVIEEDRDIRTEQRFRAIGYIGDRLYFYVFTLRGEEVEPHAISLRRANKSERYRYDNER